MADASTFRHRVVLDTDSPPVRQPLPWLCEGCGDEFWSIRKRMYCKPECRGTRPANPDGATPGTWICRGCGVEFLSGHSKRYCSTYCWHKNEPRPKYGFPINPQLGSCGSGRCQNLCPTWQSTGKYSGYWCSERCAKKAMRNAQGKGKPQNKGPRPKRTTCICTDCGIEFPRAEDGKWRKRCDPCADQVVAARLKREAEARERFRTLHPERFLPAVEVKCRTCSEAFRRSEDDKKRHWICPECRAAIKKQAKKKGKKRRRARLRGVIMDDYTIEDVIARDGWNCHVCGEETIPAPVPWEYHPRVASVDHIIPISKGGPDILANVKVACHLCNARRSATVTIEVLTLFG